MSTAIRARFGTPALDAYVARLVAEAPPLTDHQRQVLSGLLRPVQHTSQWDGGMAA